VQALDSQRVSNNCWQDFEQDPAPFPRLRPDSACWSTSGVLKKHVKEKETTLRRSTCQESSDGPPLYEGQQGKPQAGLLAEVCDSEQDVFDFVRPGGKLLRYCKRDVIIDITRRWMIEGVFDPDSEPQHGDPRSIETLAPLLASNQTPEDDPSVRTYA